MGTKRHKFEVIYDILEAIQNERGSIKPTRLGHKSNLSYKKMKEYIEDLKQKDLIKEKVVDGKKIFEMTEEGYKYLAEFKKVKEFSESFGI
ncbi:MAG: winged helix-turn-helix domain-containing protein [Candidatus Woesearchaeota archaeon]